MSLSHSVDPALTEALVKTASSLPSDRTPAQVVLAIATRAATLGLTDQQTRRFLFKQSSRLGLSDLLSSSVSRRLISAGRSAALSSSPAAADQNGLRTSRVSVGLILSPVELAEGEKGMSAVRMIRARAVMSILANEQIRSIRSERGWNTVMVSYPWLATRMRASWPTAKAALNDLVDLAWIRELTTVSRPDSARRFKIPTRLTKAQGQVIKPDHLYQAIGSLARVSDEPSLVSELIRSVAHPAWIYGSEPLGVRTWLVALAVAAGVDPVSLGVGSRYIPKAKKALAAAGLGDTNSITGAFDGWAEQTGAFVAAAKAKAAYKEAAAERTAELSRVRSIRGDVKLELDRLVGPASSFPAAGSSRDLVNGWLDGVTAAMARQVLVDARHAAMSREIGLRFKSKGWERDTISKLTEIVMGSAGSLIGSVESIPTATEDAAVKQAWLHLMAEKMAGHTLADADWEAAAVELAAKLKRRGYGEKSQKLVDLLLGSQAQAA